MKTFFDLSVSASLNFGGPALISVPLEKFLSEALITVRVWGSDASLRDSNYMPAAFLLTQVTYRYALVRLPE